MFSINCFKNKIRKYNIKKNLKDYIKYYTEYFSNLIKYIILHTFYSLNIKYHF